MQGRTAATGDKSEEASRAESGKSAGTSEALAIGAASDGRLTREKNGALDQSLANVNVVDVEVAGPDDGPKQQHMFPLMWCVLHCGGPGLIYLSILSHGITHMRGAVTIRHHSGSHKT